MFKLCASLRGLSGQTHRGRTWYPRRAVLRNRLLLIFCTVCVTLLSTEVRYKVILYYSQAFTFRKCVEAVQI